MLRLVWRWADSLLYKPIVEAMWGGKFWSEYPRLQTDETWWNLAFITTSKDYLHSRFDFDPTSNDMGGLGKTHAMVIGLNPPPPKLNKWHG